MLLSIVSTKKMMFVIVLLLAGYQQLSFNACSLISCCTSILYLILVFILRIEECQLYLT
jgi:hypothetical protein